MLDVNNSDPNWIIVGRFGRPNGIKGVITVISSTEPRDKILDYPDWHIKKDGLWQPIKRLHDSLSNKHVLTVIEGYPQREDVARLTNADIAIKKDALPVLPVGEYYWRDLIGMEVIQTDGTVLGTVDEIMPTGSNDVLIITGKQRYLIPYLPNDVVVNVNSDSRQITVDWDVDF